MTQTKDLTQGSISRQLISFALPLLVGALIQQLYSTVDMMFVGNRLGTDSAAAVGSSGLMVNCIVGFFTGLSVGVGVVAGKAVGRRDYVHLRGIIHCAAALTLLMGASLTILGWLFAPTILSWMHTPKALLPEATTYIRIYLCSVLSIVIYNIGTGILKALGDSKSPTLYQLLGGILNVAGNWLFIVVLDQGVVGAALTTLLSQTLAAALTVCHLTRLPEAFRLRLRKIRLQAKLCREILAVGIPSAVQAITISLSNVIVQSNINRLEVTDIAAFVAYYKVENVIYYPIMAVGQACSAFVSQNIGAGQTKRAAQGTRRAILLGLSVTVLICAVVLLFSHGAFSLFSKDEAVIGIGQRIARIAYPFYFLYVFLEVYAAALRGSGRAMTTMLVTIVNMCLIRVAVLLVLLSVSPTAEAAVTVYPITWGCNALCMFLFYQRERRMP